ncbi:SUF system Fe-S cluster assembly regulator [Croceicoccus sp. YJ47]|uniref:SUF system Fe-S cluster assembly regulator n=1 Tax=Croceicoccus sp. YJ47 TaxID=2798724 RepID=UPI001921F852|nr:SUF system Fe-S cluster assembly regulator [Croceicoccus sp. YJ47]QQN75626.1 SUF system Fe-S cluster assembly regulator [Croceicoccus sp. YJ47]
MRLSSMADYAVVAMRATALHCGGTRTNAAEIAAETGLPAPTVQKLVSRLGQAGLLNSVRGSGGGFRLARPAAAITLADIVEAIEGPIAMTTCATDTGDCAIEGTCGARPHWPQVNRAIRGALEQITLAQLAQEEVAA